MTAQDKDSQQNTSDRRDKDRRKKAETAWAAFMAQSADAEEPNASLPLAEMTRQGLRHGQTVELKPDSHLRVLNSHCEEVGID